MPCTYFIIAFHFNYRWGCGHHTGSSQGSYLARGQLQAAFPKQSTSVCLWHPEIIVKMRKDASQCSPVHQWGLVALCSCGHPSSSREEHGRGQDQGSATAEQSCMSPCISTQLSPIMLSKNLLSGFWKSCCKLRTPSLRHPHRPHRNNISCQKKSPTLYSHFPVLFIPISLVPLISSLPGSKAVLNGRHNHIVTGYGSPAKS